MLHFVVIEVRSSASACTELPGQLPTSRRFRVRRAGFSSTTINVAEWLLLPPPCRFANFYFLIVCVLQVRVTNSVSCVASAHLRGICMLLLGPRVRCPRPHAALTRDGGSWRSSNDLHPANASSLAAGHSRASTRSCRTTIALRPQIHTVRLTALDRDLSWLHDMEFTVRHHHRRLLSLQTIPVVSITGGLPATALPLSLVLIFDGIVSIVAITAPSVLCASPA